MHVRYAHLHVETLPTLEDCGTHEPAYARYLVCHARYDTTRSDRITGPFSSANMLKIERFQTVFKSLARGTRNVMQSIQNHYELKEASDYNRLVP